MNSLQIENENTIRDREEESKEAEKFPPLLEMDSPFPTNMTIFRA